MDDNEVKGFGLQPLKPEGTEMDWYAALSDEEKAKFDEDRRRIRVLCDRLSAYEDEMRVVVIKGNLFARNEQGKICRIRFEELSEGDPAREDVEEYAEMCSIPAYSSPF